MIRAFVTRPLGALILMIALGGPWNVGAADPLDEWHWRNPIPQGHHLQTAVHANGVTILGGDGPTLMGSSDGGINWTVLESGVAPTASNKKITSIAHGNDSFVAVMEEGSTYLLHASILTSPDGVSWTWRELPTAANTAARVVFANGQFVALASHAQDKYLLTSSNGVDWTRVDYNFSAFLLRDLIHVNGLYIGVGENAGNAAMGAIVTSPDLQDWTVQRSDVGTPMFRVAHGGGKYVAVGSSGTATSPDGVNWSDYIDFGLQESRVAIAYGNGTFISVSYSFLGDSRLFASADGTEWTGYSRMPGTFGLAFDGNQFVIPGSGGSIVTTVDGSQRTTVSDRVTFNNVANVDYGNGLFVALTSNFGSSTVYTSADGDLWEEVNYLSADKGLAFGNGVFVAVGDNGAVASSADGTVWAQNTIPPGDSLAAVAFLGGQFVAVGDALDGSADSPVLTSSDGMDWVLRTSGTAQALRDPAFGNGRYVIVGSGVALYSADAVTWTVVTPEGGFYARKVAFGNGVFFALGEFASSYVSADGENWDPVPVSGRALFFDGNRFVIGGAQGELRSSTDGVAWVDHASVTHQTFLDGVYGASSVVMVGFSGMILESGDSTAGPSAPSMQARLTGTAGELELLINGDVGSNYEIQYSTGLPPAWNFLGQILNAAALESYHDNITVDAQRVYRVLLLP